MIRFLPELAKIKIGFKSITMSAKGGENIDSVDSRKTRLFLSMKSDEIKRENS